jgi:hypothetical protein
MTKTGSEAAVIRLGSPVQALAFSENGFRFTAAAKSQNSVTIFDLRKEGDAAKAKVLDIGGSVLSLAWDYSGQCLATAGPTGITTIHQELEDMVGAVESCRAGCLFVIGRTGPLCYTLGQLNTKPSR